MSRHTRQLSREIRRFHRISRRLVRQARPLTEGEGVG
jgi:hypothetical protein